MSERFFSIAEVLDGISDKSKPSKNILYENERANGVVWCVPPGEEVPAHYHPATDDVWIVLEGEGEYYLGNGETYPLKPGIVALAEKEQIHGVRVTGDKALVFVAISAPMPVEMIKV